MNSPIYLGIDVGTSQIKGVAVDTDGRIVARSSRDHQVRTPQPGHVEHDAEADWWEGCVAVLRGLLTSPDVEATDVIALACSGIGPCVVPVDEEGRALRPAILYGVDTRATQEVDDLVQLLGASQIRERCGNDLSSQSAGPKIAWLATHEPDVHSRARWFLTCQSFLVLRLTGRAVVDHTTASYVHPFYRLDALDWDLSGITGVVEREQLPALAFSGEVAGTILPERAAELGLPPGVVVAVGTADAVAESVAVAVQDPGEVMCMYASSGFMIAPTQTPRPTAGLYCAPGVAPGRWLLAGGTSMAGAFLRWTCDVLGLTDGSGRPDFVALEALASQAPVGAAGVSVLPHLAGERTPFNDPHARGAITGLGVGHGRSHLARAAIEGVAASMALAIAALVSSAEGGRGADRDIDILTAVGGGTQSRIWLETVCDLTGLPQRVIDHDGGAAYGSAILAAIAHGSLTFEGARAWVGAAQTITPDPERSAVLADTLDRHVRTYAALHGIRDEGDEQQGRDDARVGAQVTA